MADQFRKVKKEAQSLPLNTPRKREDILLATQADAARGRMADERLAKVRGRYGIWKRGNIEQIIGPPAGDGEAVARGPAKGGHGSSGTRCKNSQLEPLPGSLDKAVAENEKRIRQIT